MHLFYASYYAYTPILGIYLYDQKRFLEFETVSFAVLFGYVVSYTFFALTPVVGPRWSLVQEGFLSSTEQRLEGYWITSFMNRIMYQGLRSLLFSQLNSSSVSGVGMETLGI
jgi:hypothetical protein